MALTRRKQLLLSGLATFLGLCSTPGCQLPSASQQPKTVAAQTPDQVPPGGGWLTRLDNPPYAEVPSEKSTRPFLGVTAPTTTAVAMLQPVAIRAASEDQSSPEGVNGSGVTPVTPVEPVTPSDLANPMGSPDGTDPWHASGVREDSNRSAEGNRTPGSESAAGSSASDGELPILPNPDAVGKASAMPPRVQPIPVRPAPVKDNGGIKQANHAHAPYVPGPDPHLVPLSGAPVPKEFDKHALSSYIIEPPDTILIQGTSEIGLPTQQIDFTNIVRPDGSIGMGIYGSVYVAGMTLEQAKQAIAAQLQRIAVQKKEVSEIVKELNVDILSFNSKVYYIITDGGGYGQRVYRLYYTGNETVLDAISNIGGIPREGSRKKIWVARATPNTITPKILPVDWRGITQLGAATTNYQIYPGDRIFIQSDGLIAADIWLNKVLSPVERVMSTILLGTGIANSVHNLRN